MNLKTYPPGYAPGILPENFIGVVAERMRQPPETYKYRQKTKGNRGNQTPGKTKGEFCQTNPIKKFFACNPHAVRHPAYGEWHEYFKKVVMGGGVKKA